MFRRSMAKVVVVGQDGLAAYCKSFCGDLFPSISSFKHFHDDKSEGVIEALKEAEAVACETSILAGALKSHDNISSLMPACKFIQVSSAGVNPLLPYWKPDQQFPILCRLAGDITTFPTQAKEWAFGHILSHHRRLTELQQFQTQKKWANSQYLQEFPTFEYSLVGKTLAILGYGDIGSEVAKTAREGFGMRTIALVNKIEARISNDNVTFYAGNQLELVLEQADYIVSILPSTKQTAGLLNNDILSKCKPTAVFLNMGRGDVISEEQLVKAAQSKWLDKIILDVFQREPLPEDSPLWGEERIIISPHVAALTVPSTVAQLFATNLKSFLDGVPYYGVVNTKDQY